MLKRRSLYLTLIASVVMVFTANSTVLAKQNQTGILGLFKADEPKSAILNTDEINKLGCEVHKQGIIGAGVGDINIDDPNKFVLLACTSSLLVNKAARSAIKHLIADGSVLAILEGELTNMPVVSQTGKPSARQYILKISHYNNENVDGREEDLKLLTEEASSRPDAYVTESFISVNHAIGMSTPDEVVVLYYNNPKQGEQFRDDNSDILENIGKFNDTHLNDFIYYVGQVTN